MNQKIIEDGKVKMIGEKDEVIPMLQGTKKCHKCADKIGGER